MVTFLLVLGSFCVLMACGVGVSLYLYHGGAIGRKHLVHTQVFRTLAGETTVADAGGDQFYLGSNSEDYASSHFARNGLLVALVSLVIIVAFVTTFLSAVMH